MTFLIASATLAGFPLLSSFFSKDTILHEAFSLPVHTGMGDCRGSARIYHSDSHRVLYLPALLQNF